MIKKLICITVLGFFVLTASSYAKVQKVVPASGEFTVTPTGFGADVAANANGKGVAVWQNGWSSICGQLYEKQFRTTVGDTFCTSGIISLPPAVTMDRSGNFVIVWLHWDSSTEYGNIYARKFDSNGTPVTDVFKVNDDTLSPRIFPRVAMDSNGNFSVIWSTWSTPVEIYIKRFNADVHPLGSETKVNTTSNVTNLMASISMSSTGKMVVSWTSWDSTTGNNINIKLFDENGDPIGDEVVVNSYANGNQMLPIVAMGLDGNFTVVWQRVLLENDPPRYVHYIYAQRFDRDGNALGNAIQVSASGLYSYPQSPAISVDDAGSFAITWDGWSNEKGSNIYARVFDKNGISIGDEFQVNQYETGEQITPRIASDGVGNFTTVWNSQERKGVNYMVEYMVEGKRFTIVPPTNQ